MIVDRYYAKISDTKGYLIVVLTDRDDNPLEDLSSVTAAEVRMRKKHGGGSVTTVPMQVNVADSQVEHQWAQDEAPEKGIYIGNVLLTYSDGLRVIPTRGFLELQFEEAI